MPEIRYICLSDLHFGADNSLLTSVASGPGDVDPSKPSEMLVLLVSCLRELFRHNDAGSKPILILNGDALELALAQDNVALMAFERFLELVFPAEGEPLIAPGIIFNPGNHDHHLWETARETQYAEFLENRRSKKPGPVLPPPWHTTNMFDPDLIESSLLNAVIGRHPRMAELGVHVGIVYPNLCLLSPHESRAVIFSHGHYVEWIYTLMTAFGSFVFPNRKVPQQIWEIEEENFAWIDFFWSAMGRSGEVGKDLERMYDMSLVPRARRQLVGGIARAIGRRWIHEAPKLGEWLGTLCAPLLSYIVKRLGGLEKTRTGSQFRELSPDAQHGLRTYIEGPLAKQILKEREQPMQATTSFIFGHTHKPFSSIFDFQGFPSAMKVYNSGGWVVDTEHTEPSHGGAVILVDDQMNVVSLRMYNEARDAAQHQVRLETADGSSNPLLARLQEVIRNSEEPWRSFSGTIARQIKTYHEHFRTRLELVR